MDQQTSPSADARVNEALRASSRIAEAKLSNHALRLETRDVLQEGQ